VTLDGRILTVVERAEKKRGTFVLRVVRTQKETAKLRAEKGINLPDTLTTVPSMTEADLRALAFIARHSDAVSLSFVRTPDDVRKLHEELDRLGRPDIGVVLKIEKREAFENLSRMLLEGLKRPPLAVMIARGDLAVEVGFERLAELQEEILWLCEASHVPTIWATQVLDTLARTGVPSRAEAGSIIAPGGGGGFHERLEAGPVPLQRKFGPQPDGGGVPSPRRPPSFRGVQRRRAPGFGRAPASFGDASPQRCAR
jgi:pyruvate kinase